MRAADSLHGAIRQCTLVAAVLAGSIVALIEARARAAPLAVSSGVVLLILTAVVGAFRQRKRDCAIDLILEGHETVPITAVQHQRRRLLSPRTRTTLARNFEDMIEQASKPAQLQMRGARPLSDLGIVAKATPDLHELVGLLHGDHVSARGVARAERLITDGASPLYGHNVSALRAELHRVHFDLLSS